MAGGHLVSLLDEHFRSFYKYKGASTPLFLLRLLLVLELCSHETEISTRWRRLWRDTDSREPPANVSRCQQHFALHANGRGVSSLAAQTIARISPLCPSPAIASGSGTQRSILLVRLIHVLLSFRWRWRAGHSDCRVEGAR